MRKSAKFLLTAITVLLVILGGGLLAISYVLLDPVKFNALVTEQIGKATGRALSINGDITPTLGLSPSLSVRDITLANADWGRAKQMLAAEEITVSFKLLPLIYGQFEVSALTLIGATIALETKAGRSNWEFDIDKAVPADDKEAGPREDGSAQTPADEASSFQIHHVHGERLQLSYHDLTADDAYAITVDSLDINEISDGMIEEVTLQGQYQEADIAINASLDGDVVQLELRAEKEGSTLGANGSFSLTDAAFDGTLTLDAQKLQTILSLARIESDNQSPIKASATLGGTAALLSINRFDVSYDGMEISGSGKADLAGSKPNIQVAANIDQLDFRKPAAPQTDGETEDGENSNDQSDASAHSSNDAELLIPDESIALDFLKDIDGIIELSVGKLLLSNTSFSKVSGKASLRENGVLRISKVRLYTADGAISGYGKLNTAMSPPQLSFTLNTENLTLGGMLAEFGDETVEGGKITSHFWMKGRGETLHHIASGMAGGFEILVEQASYTPPDDLQKASQFFEFLRGGNEAGPVTLTCGIAYFDIDDGVATSKALAVQSPAALVSGAGTANFEEETMRLTFKARSTSLGFADVVPPLLISGNWQDPSVSLDAGHTLLTIGKWAIGAATGVGLIAVVGEQFTDKLGITADNNPCMKSLDAAAQKAANADANPQEAYKDAEDNVRELRDEVKDSLKETERDVRAIRDELKGLLKAK